MLQVIEQHAPVGIFGTDARGRLLRSNARWRQIAGLDHVDHPRGAWWQMVCPLERDRVLAEWRSAVRHGHGFRSQFRVHTGRAFERFARTSISRLSGSQAQAQAYVGISEDITDQYLAQRQQREVRAELERRVNLRTRQLQTANEELTQFVHVVVHDLKAPLRAVHQLAEWLGRDYLHRLDAEGQRLLGLLRQRVHRMHDLIEGVLAYTRLGPVEESEVEVDLQRLLTGILALLAPPPHITVHLPPVLPRIQGAIERLRCAFHNLIENAIKFMDKPEGRIIVSATRLADAWEFAVTDNGPGIPARYHAQVFGMFEQLPEARQAGGTGIGLALVKRIVESRGGRVHLDSTSGSGSRFAFTWPDRPRSEPGSPS